MNNSLDFLCFMIDKDHFVDWSAEVKLRVECFAFGSKQKRTFNFSPVEFTISVMIRVIKDETFTRHRIILPLRNNNGVIVCY